jgi:hypothetical protein
MPGFGWCMVIGVVALLNKRAAYIPPAMTASIVIIPIAITRKSFISFSLAVAVLMKWDYDLACQPDSKTSCDDQQKQWE